MRKKLLDSSSFLTGKGSETEVWLYDTEVREKCLSLAVRHLWVDDNIITWNPIDWGGDTGVVLAPITNKRTTEGMVHTCVCHQFGESQRLSKPQPCSFQ